MKKIICAFLSLGLLSGIFAGCGKAVPQSDKIKIVTTVFPAYDWVRNILGDKAQSFEITLLTDNGVDMHSYQPTAADIVEISSCGLFIYVGGESDEWTEEITRMNFEKVKTLKLLEALGTDVYNEKTVEGMQNGENDEETVADEHIWLSLKNAQTLCRAICEELCGLLPEKAEYFSERLEKYLAEISALDAEYRLATDKSERKTLLFGDRFPFRYLTEDYGLTYYAAFPGCSAEAEATFETVAFLAKKLTELELPCVLTVDGSQNKIAEAIIKSSGRECPILTLCSMQAVTAEEINGGATYLSVMTDNLEILKKALN